MFEVIEIASGIVIDSFKTAGDACHFAFLVAVQDRHDGCYQKHSYKVVDTTNGKIVCLK